VSGIVAKAVKMASMLRISVLGLIENMAYVECPKCHEQIEIFGNSTATDLALRYNVPLLARLPIKPDLAKLIDEGRFETVHMDQLKEAVEAIIALG
jgi:Mrp family chromosome partitioning ATPase